MNSENLSQGLDQFEVPGANFGFTGANFDNIGAMDQTLYGLVVDESGSTSPFRPEMIKAIQATVASLEKSPRADNLMFRMSCFSNDIREIHGYKPLKDCHVGHYADVFEQAGQTSLYDATLEMSESMRVYAENLAENSYIANGIIVVITDGLDLGSTHGPNDVRKSFEEMIQGEHLESLMTILIGVNIEDDHVKQKLELYKEEAGFTDFHYIKDATEKSMAKWANFVSRSVTSQSQHLGSGGPSQSLVF